jgi:hypothetical protein
MRDLNERERRFIITMGVIIAIILFAAAVGYFTGGWDANPQ